MVAAASCFTLRSVTIGQKTSLERQLMGEVEPLTEQELLASSVRAAGGVGAGSVDDVLRRALGARRRQLFNRDDIDELKANGCLGEAAGARLVGRGCARQAEAATAPTVARLVEQENSDRQAIIDWAIATDPLLTPKDREQVIQVYHLLLREQARAGDWVQGADWAWTQR
jgi:hypothetical protein